MLQLTPLCAGSESLTVTDVAAPVPVLATVTVYPMAAPAVTVAASAVFVILMLGHWTVVVADACTVALLLADALATLTNWAQLADDVLLVTCTTAFVDVARLAIVQLSN